MESNQELQNNITSFIESNDGQVTRSALSRQLRRWTKDPNVNTMEVLQQFGSAFAVRKEGHGRGRPVELVSVNTETE